MRLLKSKFFSSTLILILSGLATKGLGLVIRLLFVRIAGEETLSLYTIVMPTYSLILSIASFSIPTTVAKLYAENGDIKVLSNAFIIIFVINFLIVLFMFIASPFIASVLLKNPACYKLLIACSLSLPLASIACILKGYFYGKQKMIPHAVSNFTEQIIRICLIIFIIPVLLKRSTVDAAMGLILTSVITEFASICIFLAFMDKKDRIFINSKNYRKNYTREILSISSPLVIGSIFANICYFLEPIILTNVLAIKGFSNATILLEYAAYNAYAIGLLLLPSFFINAISLSLIPEVSSNIRKENFKIVKLRLIEAFIFAFIIGFSFCVTSYFFARPLLKLLFNTSRGVNYIKALSFVFIFFYFEGIFRSFFQSTKLTKVSFKITFITCFLKTILLFLFCVLGYGFNSLIYSEIINIMLTFALNLSYFIYYIRKMKASPSS